MLWPDTLGKQEVKTLQDTQDGVDAVVVVVGLSILWSCRAEIVRIERQSGGKILFDDLATILLGERGVFTLVTKSGSVATSQMPQSQSRIDLNGTDGAESFKVAGFPEQWNCGLLVLADSESAENF